MDKWIVEVIKSIDNMKLEQNTQKNHISRTRIKSYILNGNVLVDGKIIKNPSHIINNELEIIIKIPPLTDSIPKPENINLKITYEDNDILIIDKQPGLVVHPAPGNEEGTLVNGILFHCKNSLSGIGGVKRPGIVHRLDKDTSGLMIVAKSEIAHVNLVNMFQKHQLKRQYKALVWNLPNKIGFIEKPVGRSKVNRKKMAVVENGKYAKTYWEVVENFSDTVSLIECKLETGRTHQIRVHMSYLGFNLVGDQTYGLSPSTKNIFIKEKINIIENCKQFYRQALHSSNISFNHPVTNKKMIFSSDLPRDISDLIKKF